MLGFLDNTCSLFTWPYIFTQGYEQYWSIFFHYPFSHFSSNKSPKMIKKREVDNPSFAKNWSLLLGQIFKLLNFRWGELLKPLLFLAWDVKTGKSGREQYLVRKWLNFFVFTTNNKFYCIPHSMRWEMRLSLQVLTFCNC